MIDQEKERIQDISEAVLDERYGGVDGSLRLIQDWQRADDPEKAESENQANQVLGEKIHGIFVGEREETKVKSEIENAVSENAVPAVLEEKDRDQVNVVSERMKEREGNQSGDYIQKKAIEEQNWAVQDVNIWALALEAGKADDIKALFLKLQHQKTNVIYELDQVKRKRESLKEKIKVEKEAGEKNKLKQELKVLERALQSVEDYVRRFEELTEEQKQKFEEKASKQKMVTEEVQELADLEESGEEKKKRASFLDFFRKKQDKRVADDGNEDKNEEKKQK